MRERSSPRHAVAAARFPGESNVATTCLKEFSREPSKSPLEESIGLEFRFKSRKVVRPLSSSHGEGRWPWAPVVFQVLAWLFAACVLVQVLLFGLGFFDFSGPAMSFHRVFPEYFQFLPILNLLLALLAKGPRGKGLYAYPLALLVLIFFQYWFIGRESGVLKAMHPVSGTLMFAVAILGAVRSHSWKIHATPAARHEQQAVGSNAGR